MAPEFFLAIAPVALVLYVIYKKHTNHKKQAELLLAGLGETVVKSMYKLACETVTSGLKNRDFLFSNCDLHLTRDAVILVGYTRTGFTCLFSTPIILTYNIQAYAAQYPFVHVVKPEKVNPYSFNNEVYITFGNSGFATTNVEIRLKGVTDDIKRELDKLCAR